MYTKLIFCNVEHKIRFFLRGWNYIMENRKLYNITFRLNCSFNLKRGWPLNSSMQMLMIRTSWGNTKNMEECFSLLILMQEGGSTLHTHMHSLLYWDSVRLGSFHFCYDPRVLTPPTIWADSMCNIHTTARSNYTTLEESHNRHSQISICSWPMTSSS